MSSKYYFVLFFAMCFSTNAQDTSKVKYIETVMIRMIENQCSDYNTKLIADATDPKIIVLDADGETEVVALQKAHIADDSDHAFDNNSRVLKVQIQKWNNKGFQVISLASTTVRECITITTLLMGKQ